MKQNTFAACHPAVNFLFFLGAIGFGVVIQHPAYLLAGCLMSTVYYMLIQGKKGLKTLLMTLPLTVFMAVINPIFNTRGDHILFYLFGRPYTLEALLFGITIGGIFLVMMMWFGCYNVIVTSDKFVCLFGNLIPAISLLLVLILRMIPNLLRKAKQIIGARDAVGKGISENNTSREKIDHGMTVLSALTDWALEGSVVTADSMRARGYGTAKHSNFQIYRFTGRDLFLMILLIVLMLAVICFGDLRATFLPKIDISPLSWGFAAYCIFISIPTVLQIKEAITWRILRSKI